jgi:hypothetical protein
MVMVLAAEGQKKTGLGPGNFPAFYREAKVMVGVQMTM